MPAAVPPARAASSDVRRSSGNPWRVELRELGRRAGSMQVLEKTVPAPDGWRLELIGVPAGAPVELRLRLESVMEGVLVSGEVDVPVTGSCARCLEPFDDTVELDVQELYAYEGSTTDETSDEDEVRLVENDRIDLEPMVRDLVVLALPLSPVCSDDCQGLCVDCGQRLDELPPDHSHEVIDPRFAALADRFASSPQSGDDNPEEN